MISDQVRVVPVQPTHIGGKVYVTDKAIHCKVCIDPEVEWINRQLVSKPATWVARNLPEGCRLGEHYIEDSIPRQLRKHFRHLDVDTKAIRETARYTMLRYGKNIDADEIETWNTDFLADLAWSDVTEDVLAGKLKITVKEAIAMKALQERRNARRSDVEDEMEEAVARKWMRMFLSQVIQHARLNNMSDDYIESVLYFFRNAPENVELFGEEQWALPSGN